MIYLNTGTPGSGKSLDMAKDIMFKLNRKDKNTVLANFAINTAVAYGKKKKKYAGKFIYVDNADLHSPQWLIDYALKHHELGVEGQALLCLDEAQLLFNCREMNSGDRNQWIEFFTQHRKLGYNIIMCALNDRMIDRQIRVLTEYEVKHRKVGNAGSIGMILYVFHLFAKITYWYGAKEKVSTEFFRFKKQHSKLYDSYKLFRGFKSTLTYINNGAYAKNEKGELVEVEDSIRNSGEITEHEGMYYPVSYFATTDIQHEEKPDRKKGVESIKHLIVD